MLIRNQYFCHISLQSSISTTQANMLGIVLSFAGDVSIGTVRGKLLVSMQDWEDKAGPNSPPAQIGQDEWGVFF